jgi:hypothetical protein
LAQRGQDRKASTASRRIGPDPAGADLETTVTTLAPACTG